ncbi:MAG: hypothetical protein DMG14_00405 [Acidobacteria bacterium]|nr:MAG: hypothetical protein DMG14_00405 [Acidobacteriota bacterium]
MRFKVLTFLAIVACFLTVVSALAQGADPLSGTWIGDWGPSPNDRNDVTLQLKWDGKALTGNVTAGTNVTKPIPLQKTMFDPKTGAVHMEADASSRGRTIHYVIDGKVEKGTMTGSWNHDNRKGDFKITKK